MTPGIAPLLWFFAVVALIPLALWLLKRTPLAGPGGGRAGAPRPVAVLPLSAQQKLVTVEVGLGDARQWLVLGVSPQGIRTLHTMAAQGEAADAPAAPPGAAFAQLFSKLRGPGSGGNG
ncbi:MAG: flagellar biosynthetic protein FliO [Rubrivivax sp.]|nr:flagellar biosynthetic protein FliO [Rubrivivax sp.]